MDAETIEYKGYTIHIKYDEDPVNPREEFDNLTKMVCFHRRYNLGDEHSYDSSDYSGWDEVQEAIIQNENAVAILPLYLYDHSGITMYTTGNTTYHQHAAWDSGQVGFIFITREAAINEYGWKHITKARREKLEEYCRGDVETYDQYLTGQVYGYEIEDPDGCDKDSCWGFFGDMKYCIEEAKSVVDCYVDNPEPEDPEPVEDYTV